MSGADTLTIETVSGHKVVVKAWLTGREVREIRRPFFKAAKIDTQAETPVSFEQISPEVIEESENILIQTAVISVDGVSENVLEKVLGLPAPDFQEVVDKLNEISQGLTLQRQKKS